VLARVSCEYSHMTHVAYLLKSHQHIIPYPPDLPAMPENFALEFFHREINLHLRLGTSPG
jgi:hypothetical protein